MFFVLFTACKPNTIPQQEQFPSPIPSLKSTQIEEITPTFVEPSVTATVTSVLPTNSPVVTETAVILTPLPEVVANPMGIVVDHDFMAQFDSIPDEEIAKSSLWQVLFRHSSVGENIRFGLECLYGDYGSRRPNACSPTFDPKYDSSRWVFQFRGNPGWIDKVKDFIHETEAQYADFKVFMFTLGYLDGLDGMTYPQISDPDNFNSLYLDPLLELEQRYPDKIFVWWTMSLAQEGQDNTTQFNQMLREYAQENPILLMDLADIESHDLEGNPCLDGEGRPVICKIYTDEKQAGHLNTFGREHLAKAFWYLMARISGWQDS